MRSPAVLFTALVLIVGPISPLLAAQPENVGELLAAGGKQLTKAEILNQFSGATITGTAMGAPGSTFRLQYFPDGTAVGEGSPPAGTSVAIRGSWSANDRDQYCQELRTAAGNPIGGCFYYFRMGDGLFAAPSNAPSAPVYERQLRR